MARILVVDDEQPIRKFLRTSLAAHEHDVIEAANASDGIALAAARKPDLILLDLGLPDMDGLEVTKRLREWTATPIIVLSAREQEHDKIDALDAGADDYLTKPFGVGELVARIRVALRHTASASQGASAPVFCAGDLRVDIEKRQVFVGEQEVHLTPTEYKLLVLLVQHAGKVVTQQQLLKAVWGPAYAQESQYLRVYMGQLRHKLERDPARPRYLITEPGVGYRLKVEG
jgi:two-component system KDP operon response regulator KdpE